MAGFQLKRVYEPASKEDGYRVLVDRLWPRGLKREAPQLDLWAKALAPSSALRKWFNHEPARFEAFSAQYREELADESITHELNRLRHIAESGPVTLLYAAKDEQHNQAVVLKQVLES